MTTIEQRAPRILSVGYLVDHLRARNERLREAGFAVDSASDASEAAELVRSVIYDAAVFGAAVPEEVRNAMAAAVRAKNSKAVIVMLYWSGIQHAELADAVLHINTSDADLQNIIAYMLESRTATTAQAAGAVPGGGGGAKV